jgi:hypothetical protein
MYMKKLLFVVTLVVFLAATANLSAQKVQGYMESENVITSSATTPQLNALAYGPISGKVGWEFWGINSRTWSEGYIGPTYTPKPCITLSAGAGAETGGARFGWSASGKKGKYFYASIHEWGKGSGYWYKNYVTKDVTPRITVGVWGERCKGFGPTVNIRVFKEFRPYATVFATKGSARAIVGATYSFSFGRK